MDTNINDVEGEEQESKSKQKHKDRAASTSSSGKKTKLTDKGSGHQEEEDGDFLQYRYSVIQRHRKFQRPYAISYQVREKITVFGKEDMACMATFVAAITITLEAKNY